MGLLPCLLFTFCKLELQVAIIGTQPPILQTQPATSETQLESQGLNGFLPAIKGVVCSYNSCNSRFLHII